MIRKCEIPNEASFLFEGWEETMIWSCLQGVMGTVYVEEAESGQESRRQNSGIRSAAAVLGDFSFFAGKPSDGLVSFWPGECCTDFRIMVPENEAWALAIENFYGKQARRVTRYAMKKEPDVFQRKKLLDIVNALGEEYSLHRIDEALYHRCFGEAWCRDLVSQYETYEKYSKLGLGVVAMKDGCIVSGASSYTSYQGGIEIEIDTKNEYRRRGLALACGAKLILDCMDRGLYPSWDAQNPGSAALAEKLGYHFDHEYAAYEVCRQENSAADGKAAEWRLKWEKSY